METLNSTNKNMESTASHVSQQKQGVSDTLNANQIFHTNHPQAAYQRKIATLMNNSPQVNSIAQLQKRVTNSARIASFNDKPFITVNAPVQRAPMKEEELKQAKFTAQRKKKLDEEKLQGKFPNQNTTQLKHNNKATAQRNSSASGIPDNVKINMETATGHDFSNVQLHKNSSKAVDVGALSYAQGNDIHFAPGQFSPNTTAGKSLLGHELTHVAQQREGRVQPTVEVSGMPVNDNPSLETEADTIGGNALR